MEYNIYTDGGCRNNPGLGAWAFAVFNDQGKLVLKESDSKLVTTNNEMELTAIAKSIDLAIHHLPSNSKITIHSDSSYSINSITQWSDKWVKDGSILSRPNGGLILSIKTAILRLGPNRISFNKVKGHSGIPGNEFVDQLLNQTMDSIGHKSKIRPADQEGRYELYGDCIKLISNSGVECSIELTADQLDIIRGLQ